MTLYCSSSKLMEFLGKVRPCADPGYHPCHYPLAASRCLVPMETASRYPQSPADNQPVKSVFRLDFETLAHCTCHEPQFPYLQNELFERGLHDLNSPRARKLRAGTSGKKWEA